VKVAGNEKDSRAEVSKVPRRSIRSSPERSERKRKRVRKGGRKIGRERRRLCAWVCFAQTGSRVRSGQGRLSPQETRNATSLLSQQQNLFASFVRQSHGHVQASGSFSALQIEFVIIPFNAPKRPLRLCPSSKSPLPSSHQCSTPQRSRKCHHQLNEERKAWWPR
jgi:hypothetical protein